MSVVMIRATYASIYVAKSSLYTDLCFNKSHYAPRVVKSYVSKHKSSYAAFTFQFHDITSLLCTSFSSYSKHFMYKVSLVYFSSCLVKIL